MPDSQEGTTKQQQSQDFPQSQIDQAFAGLAQQVPPSPQFAQELLHVQGQAYWRLAEDALRTAKEVSEHQMLFLVRQQITQEAAYQAIPQVINYLRSNPQVVQQIVRQAQ